MPDTPEHLPGKGLLGWLGRQVGHVRRAVKAEPLADKVLYRSESTEAVPHPVDPSITLKRTVIDEAVRK